MMRIAILIPLAAFQTAEGHDTSDKRKCDDPDSW